MQESRHCGVLSLRHSSGTTLNIDRCAADSLRRVCFLFFSLWLLACAGCAGGHTLVRRDVAANRIHDAAPNIDWFGPAKTSDTATLTRWRAAVGPPVSVTVADARHPAAADAVTIVSWNTALGAADVVRFVRSLPDPGAPLILLLQEVYRGGLDVPGAMKGLSFAKRLGGARDGSEAREIETVARTLGLSLYYVPSMRNGGDSDEDRGNAILSNLALDGLAAVELPFERQRRVAVAAFVSGQTREGQPWRFRVVSAHLDNTGGAKRAWIAGEYGRARQARGLADWLGDEQPTVLAGDFNTWFGFADQAYVETARAFPDPGMVDRRATFRGLLRLDHVFLRLAPGWRAEFRRASDRYGSDHYPLVGTLRFR